MKLLEKLPGYRLTPAEKTGDQPELQASLENETPAQKPGAFGRIAVAGLLFFFAWLFLQLSFPHWRDAQWPREHGTARITAVDGTTFSGRIATESAENLTLINGAGENRAFPKAGNRIDRAEPLPLRAVNAVSILAIPFLLSLFPLYAAVCGLKVYEEFVEGAKEGFHVAVRIIPFLVTMLVAIGMFRAAGGITMLSSALDPLLRVLQFPTELVPLALMRPLSGSGSNALLADLIQNPAFGPDHLFTRMAGTIIGSTETTFYVIAVYFGAVAIRRTRHAIPAGLFADFVGIVASVIICRLMFA